MKIVDVRRIQIQVETTLKGTPYPHRKLVTSVLITESANRSEFRREIEYLAVNTWARAGFTENQIMDRTLGLGQVSLRNALKIENMREPSSSSELQKVIEALMDDDTNIIMVSKILLSIEREINLSCTDWANVRMIANKYNSGSTSRPDAIYGDVVATIWKYIDQKTLHGLKQISE